MLSSSKERRSEAKSGLLSLKPVTIPDRYMNCAMRAERHPPHHWCPATVNFQTSQHKREKPNTQNPVVQIGSSCRLLMLPRDRSTSAVRPAAPDTLLTARVGKGKSSKLS